MSENDEYLLCYLAAWMTDRITTAIYKASQAYMHVTRSTDKGIRVQADELLSKFRIANGE